MAGQEPSDEQDDRHPEVGRQVASDAAPPAGNPAPATRHHALFYLPGDLPQGSSDRREHGPERPGTTAE
jgi:hypothetical protein